MSKGFRGALRAVLSYERLQIHNWARDEGLEVQVLLLFVSLVEFDQALDPWPLSGLRLSDSGFRRSSPISLGRQWARSHRSYPAGPERTLRVYSSIPPAISPKCKTWQLPFNPDIHPKPVPKSADNWKMLEGLASSFSADSGPADPRSKDTPSTRIPSRIL